MPTDIDQSLDEIIKQTKKRNGKGPAKRQITKNPKNTLKVHTVAKKTKLTTRSLRRTGVGAVGNAKSGRGRQARRMPQKPIQAMGGISTKLQNLSQRANAKLRTNNTSNMRSNSVRNQKNRRGQTTLNQPRTSGGVAKPRASLRTLKPQQQQHQPSSITSPVATQNIQISVKSPYVRQVDTDPSGIDIGEVPIHMTSMTTNMRFSSVEATREIASPPPPAPVSIQPQFARKLRINRGPNFA